MELHRRSKSEASCLGGILVSLKYHRVFHASCSCSLLITFWWRAEGLTRDQRKLLLFELTYQQTVGQSNLLLVLDEPFTGVKMDDVPFLVDRLNDLRERHYVLIATSDHTDTLKAIADVTVQLSTVDRSTVQVNGLTSVARQKAILALCMCGL
jgi:ABC-type branched-subunit amino acid transport system ATPase component